MNFRYLRENYREIILQGTRRLWQRFPEAALLNLVHLLYQGGFLLLYSAADVDEDWFFWTERLISLLLVAVAAELWRERRPEWQPGRWRWKIWGMLAVWGLVFEAGTRCLQGFEEAMFHLVSPCFWFCLLLYFMLPKAKEGQSLQLRNCAGAMATALALGFLVAFLLGICLAAVEALLLEFPEEVHIFLLGVVPLTCAINVFLCLAPRGGENPASGEHSVSRIVTGLIFPCYLVLLLILYLYIGKIILQQEMPIGAMNLYASLALLGYGCFYFFWNDIRQHWFVQFMRWGLVLFLPILVVQFYGIWIRYEAYGLTTLRYLSMIFTAYGILLLIARRLQKEIRCLLLVAAVLMVIFSLSPLNVMRVPLHNQEARLIGLLEQEGLYVEGRIALTHPVSPERAPAVKSCVDYIYQESAEDEEFSQQVKEIAWKDYLPGMDVPPAKPKQENRVVFLPRTKGVPVGGYRLAYPFPIRNWGADITLENGEKRQVDLKDYATRLVEDCKEVPWQEHSEKSKMKCIEFDDVHELSGVYELDDQSALYFTELTVWQDGAGNFLRLSGKGYYLVK